jgi:molecular chaperone GrpE
MAEQTVNDQDPRNDTGVEDPAAERPSALDDLRREKEALQDRLLRTAAEFDNYRKRVDKERRDLAEYASADMIGEVLPILDNFERALQAFAAAAGPEAEAFRKGVELIHKQLLDLLRKRGVRPIDTAGADFDPNIHEAVIHEASSDHREGEVIAELQRGYTLGDRLLRPAMVKVARRP